MSTTTFAAIRDAQTAAIRAIVPTSHVEQSFDVHRLADMFDEWVDLHADACWRRFEISASNDYTLVGTTDGHTDTLTGSLVVSVGYPLQLGRYGAENRRDLDDMIEEDMVSIDGAVGRRGYVNYPQGQHGAIFTAMQSAATKSASAIIVRLVFQFEYDRSV